jgi:hypothetical protein
MIVSASILQDSLGIFLALRGAGFAGNPLGAGIGLLVSLVINTGAVSTWIQHTYGIPAQP